MRVRVIRIVAAAALLAVISCPAAVARERSGDPYVPQGLLKAADKNQAALFRVIVQGTRGGSSDQLGVDVKGEVENRPHRGAGVKHEFASVSAVSATLTGRQITELAGKDWVLAITPDVPLRGADAPPAATGPVAVVSPPTISGDARDGSTLTASAGSWSAPATFSFQWQRCDPVTLACVDVAGAAAADYVVGPADAGAALRVVVTAVVGLDAPVSAASAPTATIAALPPTPVPVPVPVPAGPASLQQWPYAAGADGLWAAVAAAKATPPTIAIVDSGVDGSLAGLKDSVGTQETLTTLAQRPEADGYGHGSFVAAIAAGHRTDYTGAAPTARIISLDVMDDQGMARTSDVIAAADWIYEHKDAEGIRVANFSLLGSTPSVLRFDPLDRALERLWFSGVVVVVAAGNYAVDGASSVAAFSPANDPFVLTVGASDVSGTTTVTDDVAAPWSAWGHTPEGFAKPELGAPGRYLVAETPVGSTLYTSRPERVVAPGLLQLSGTSFAAPAVAGIAADLLALHPDWTPGQVKGALMLTAAQSTQATFFSLGVGLVDGRAALAVSTPPDADAALAPFVVTDPAGGRVFDAAAWQVTVQADASWGTASWGTASWGTASWGTASWGTTYWSSASWGTGAPSELLTASDNASADVLPGGGYWR
jgi:serine protease AprX